MENCVMLLSSSRSIVEMNASTVAICNLSLPKKKKKKILISACELEPQNAAVQLDGMLNLLNFFF